MTFFARRGGAGAAILPSKGSGRTADDATQHCVHRPVLVMGPRMHDLDVRRRVAGPLAGARPSIEIEASAHGRVPPAGLHCKRLRSER